MEDNKGSSIITLYFEIRHLEAQVMSAEADIEKLNVNKEQLEYRLHLMKEEYNRLGLTLKGDTSEDDAREDSEEVKPKKLRKPDAQPS